MTDQRPARTIAERRTFEVDGTVRAALVVRPSFPQEAPGRLLLALHGSGSSGARFRRQTGGGLDRWAAEGSGTVVYPDSWQGSLWDDARRSTPSKAREAGVDDLGLLRALRTELSDANGAVFGVGYSNGGQMVIRAALAATRLLDAAALLSATVAVDDNLLAEGGASPLPVLMSHGTKDPLVPFEGGMASIFGFRPRGRMRSAQESARFWASRNGISAEPVTTSLPHLHAGDRTRTELAAFEQHGRPPVHFYATRSGGHVVSGPGTRQSRLLGPTTQDLDLPALVLDFFERAGRLDAATS